MVIGPSRIPLNTPTTPTTIAARYTGLNVGPPISLIVYGKRCVCVNVCTCVYLCVDATEKECSLTIETIQCSASTGMPLRKKKKPSRHKVIMTDFQGTISCQ